TAGPKQFQLFQPNAGVRPMVEPTTILKSRLASPREFFACKMTLYSPAVFRTPVIRPEVGSSFSPVGRFSAVKPIGRSPVAAIVNKKGFPGRTPKTFAPLMRGFGDGFGVRTTASSCGAALVAVVAAAGELEPVVVVSCGTTCATTMEPLTRTTIEVIR